MALKQYQESLLEDYSSFLARTREVGDPAVAFRESTKDHFGFEIPYRSISNSNKAKRGRMRVVRANRLLRQFDITIDQTRVFRDFTVEPGPMLVLDLTTAQPLVRLERTRPRVQYSRVAI